MVSGSAKWGGQHPACFCCSPVDQQLVPWKMLSVVILCQVKFYDLYCLFWQNSESGPGRGEISHRVPVRSPFDCFYFFNLNDFCSPACRWSLFRQHRAFDPVVFCSFVWWIIYFRSYWQSCFQLKDTDLEEKPESRLVPGLLPPFCCGSHLPYLCSFDPWI